MPINYENEVYYKGNSAPAGQFPRDMAVLERVIALEEGGAGGTGGVIINRVAPFSADDELPLVSDFQLVADESTTAINDTIRYVTPSGEVWLSYVRSDGTETGKTVTDPELLNSSHDADGGFESITLATVQTLSPSDKDGFLREYIITATTPVTQVEVDGVMVDVVEFPMAPPTEDNQAINVIRASSVQVFLKPAAQDGWVLNDNPGNRTEAKLRSSGGVWVLAT